MKLLSLKFVACLFTFTALGAMSKESPPTLVFSLTVKDAAEALEFYAKAFGATELFRMPLPDGSIAHAEFQIGNFSLSISGEYPDWNAVAFGDGATSPF